MLITDRRLGVFSIQSRWQSVFSAAIIQVLKRRKGLWASHGAKVYLHLMCLVFGLKQTKKRLHC